MAGLATVDRQLGLDRHARLQHAVAVVGRDLDAVHELRALLRGLHVARRELRLRRDERDRPVEAAAAGVGDERRRLAEPQPRHERLVDVDVGPRVIEIGDRRPPARAARPSRRRRASFAVTMPATGDLSVASATLFCSAAICASTAATRARAAAISCGRAPARSRATRLARRALRALCAPRARRAAATSRRVAASSRCLREPAFDAQQRSRSAAGPRPAASSSGLRPPARRPAPTAPAPRAWRMSSGARAGLQQRAAAPRPDRARPRRAAARARRRPCRAAR